MLEYKSIGTFASNSTKPVGILLHGFGASAEDIHGLAHCFIDHISDWYIPQGKIDLNKFVAYPGRAWFPDTHEEIHAALTGEYWKQLHLLDTPSITEVAQELYQQIQQLGFLTRPLVLAGFSQGAILCSELAMLLAQNNIQVSAMLLFSGALLAEQRWNINCQDIYPILQNIKIIQFHGNADSVISLHDAEKLYTFWKQYNNTIHFHTFDGGHEIPEFAIHTTQLFLQNFM